MGELREMVFRKDDIPRVDFEPGMPYSVFVDTWLQLSEFAGWEEIARWGISLFPRDAQGSLLDRETDAIKAQAGTAPERVLAALAFVQKEIRYFGTEIGPYNQRPASPEAVLKKRFGDCKDKVALLITLLGSFVRTCTKRCACRPCSARPDEGTDECARERGWTPRG